ncbi:MAG: GNAT family N-acetyltransferase [Streptococcaceae bacterium]|nr:GNAT family N-acetyltransferase [Streptococcaceae bacterium]
MSEEINLIIRQAIPDDAENLLYTLNQIRQETDFLTMDENDVNISIEFQRHQLENIYESENNVLILAFDGEKIIGSISVHANSQHRIKHIGEIGISILKEYWGLGLGSILLEEAIYWAKESGIIRRLELTVQKRNQKAIHLYEKFGFQTETIMQRGAVDEQDNFLDVHLMSLLIDPE